MTIEYEPFSSASREDPYPVFAQLRSHDPVHFAPESGTYCISRYDDAVFVLKRPERFSSQAMMEVLMQIGSA